MPADANARPRRRVLHLIDSYGLGGAQVILRDYLRQHTPAEEKTAYALRRVADEVIEPGPDALADPDTAKYSFAPIDRLRRLIEAQGIDVLHCHLFRSQVFGYWLKRRHFPGINLVFHEHGRVVGREAESRLEAFVFRQFVRTSAGRIDAYICNSETTRERLLRLAPAARAFAIRNPIRGPRADPTPAARRAARATMGLPADAFVVGFAGRLVVTKGWRDFLDAIALVRDVPVRFAIAGDGMDREAAAAHVQELGLAGRGSLLGYVQDMEPFYSALDCLVMPSHWESHGLSQLEAQAFGVPVVVSDVPGLVDTVNPAIDALVCRARDTRAFAYAIERLAGDAALRERLAAAGVANAARHSMPEFACRLSRVYDEIQHAGGGVAPAGAATPAG